MERLREKRSRRVVSKGARRSKVNVDKTDVFVFSNACDLRRGFGTGRQAPPLNAAFLPPLSVVAAEVPVTAKCPVSFL